MIRAWMGVAFVAAGLGLCFFSALLGGISIVFGLFALYEAKRGWCMARACGIKTRF